MKSPLKAVCRILFVGLTIGSASFVMGDDDAQTAAPPTFYGGVHGIFPNAELPPHVPAPAGKLTLYADFGGKDAGGIPLFLVNRTSHPLTFDSQDGDIF